MSKFIFGGLMTKSPDAGAGVADCRYGVFAHGCDAWEAQESFLALPIDSMR
jgi:hypothetical protein